MGIIIIEKILEKNTPKKSLPTKPKLIVRLNGIIRHNKNTITVFLLEINHDVLTLSTILISSSVEVDKIIKDKIINNVVSRYVKEAGKIRKKQDEQRRIAQEKQAKQLRREEEKRRLAEEIGKKKRAERKKAREAAALSTKDGPEIEILEDDDEDTSNNAVVKKDDESKGEEAKPKEEEEDEDSDDDGTPKPEGNGGETDEYRWIQTLKETTIYVHVPSGTKGKHVNVTYNSNKCEIGMKGKPALLKGEFFNKIRPDECTWTLEDCDEGRDFVLYLLKDNQMEWWRSVV